MENVSHHNGVADKQKERKKKEKRKKTGYFVTKGRQRGRIENRKRECRLKEKNGR